MSLIPERRFVFVFIVVCDVVVFDTRTEYVFVFIVVCDVVVFDTRTEVCLFVCLSLTVVYHSVQDIIDTATEVCVCFCCCL